MKYLKKITELFLLAFVFLLPWQTKLILRPSTDNFTEVSLYLSHCFLIIAILFFFVYQLLNRGKLGKTSLIWYFLAVLEISVLLSFFLATDKFIAAFHYFILLLGFGLFYLLQEGFKREPYEDSCINRSRAILVFLSSMFIQSILGIYQFLKQSTFSSKFLGLAEHSTELFGASVVETSSGRWLRAYGGLDHPNIFGGVLVFVLLLTAVLLASKKLINSKLEKWTVMFLFLGYFFALSALFFTFSRSAWLALIFGFLILAILIFYQEDRLAFKRLMALGFFSVILFILAALPYYELVTTRVTADGRLEKISISERQQQLNEGLKIIKQRPILGVGRGNYLQATDNGQVIAVNQQPIHNSFLLIFSESGIFAFLSVISLLVVFIINKKRQALALSIIIALVILMMLDHWFFSLPFGVLFFFFILGVI